MNDYYIMTISQQSYLELKFGRELSIGFNNKNYQFPNNEQSLILISQLIVERLKQFAKNYRCKCCNYCQGFESEYPTDDLILCTNEWSKINMDSIDELDKFWELYEKFHNNESIKSHWQCENYNYYFYIELIKTQGYSENLFGSRQMNQITKLIKENPSGWLINQINNHM